MCATMPTYLRRFTRLSLEFSETLEHLTAAIHLHMAFSISAVCINLSAPLPRGKRELQTTFGPFKSF